MSASIQDHVSQTVQSQASQPKTSQPKASNDISDIALNQGRFISFEGTEGVGKTTAIEQLCTRLDDSYNIAYLRTRERVVPVCRTFARYIIAPATDINDDTELLLLFAARCDHMQQVILPALQRGTWVVCDRFTGFYYCLSRLWARTWRCVVRAKIESIIEQFVPQLPELALWLDLPVLEGMARANKM